MLLQEVAAPFAAGVLPLPPPTMPAAAPSAVAVSDERSARLGEVKIEGKTKCKKKVSLRVSYALSQALGSPGRGEN